MDEEFEDVCVDETMVERNGIKIDHAQSESIDFKTLMKATNLGTRCYVDSLYLGQYSSRQRNGKGIMKYKNGRVYEGEFRNDMRNGFGYESYQNGNTYVGLFKDGKAHGKGIYKWMNTEVYDGEWDEGLKHGYGMW